MKNWKTSLFALLAFLANIPVLINAGWDWSEGKPVNWKFVCVSIAMSFLAWAAHQAKDKDVSSTLPEVMAATQQANQQQVAAAALGQKPSGPQAG